MKLKRLDALLLQLMLISLAGIIVATVAGMNSLASLFFYLTFPLTAALWLRYVRFGLDATDFVMIAAAALAVLHVLIDWIISCTGFSLGYYKKLIMFIMTLMFLQTCNKVWAGKRIRALLHNLMAAVTIFLVFMYLIFKDEMRMLGDVPARYAVFRFTNPNLAAIFFTCMYMLAFIRMASPLSRNEKIFHGVLAGTLGLLILATTSRNGLLIMLLFTGLALCVLFRDRVSEKIHFPIKLRIHKAVAAVAAVFPAVFAVVYMELIGAQWVQKVFSFLVSEGKKLDSRVKEWQPAFEMIREYPWTGTYYGVTGGSGAGQMHNTHVDIAASYGIQVLILVCVLLAVYIYQGGKRYKNQTEFLYMAAFCCTLMLGIFESVMFSGGLGVYIFLGMFLMLSGQKQNRRKVQILKPKVE